MQKCEKKFIQSTGQTKIVSTSPTNGIKSRYLKT